VEPVGSRRELWRIVAELAARMGIELPAVAGVDDSDELIRSVMKRSRVTLDELRAAPSGVVVDAPGAGWLVPDPPPPGPLDPGPAGGGARTMAGECGDDRRAAAPRVPAAPPPDELRPPRSADAAARTVPHPARQPRRRAPARARRRRRGHCPVGHGFDRRHGR